MRFPEYSENFYNTEISPVDVFIEHVGKAYPQDLTLHRDPADHRRGSIIRASLLIGRACFLAGQDPAQSIAVAQQVQQELEPQIERETAHGNAYSHYNIAQLVEHHDDPDTIKRIRHNMHHDSLDKFDRLASRIPQTPPMQAINRGTRSQLRAEAFFSRIRHPWFLSLNALLHHDQSKNKPANYDLAVVEALPVETLNDEAPETVTSFHRIQIKNSCFGECKTEADPDKRRVNKSHLKAYREAYSPSVKLLSGCCDFRNPDSGELADHLLFKEFRRTANKKELQILDSITEHVLFLATAPGEFTGRGGLHSVGAGKLNEKGDLHSSVPTLQPQSQIVAPEPLTKTPQDMLERLQARFNSDYVKTP